MSEHRSQTSAWLVAVCALSFASWSEAQNQNPEKPDPEKFDDPSARSETSGSFDRIVLEAGDADGRATARVVKVVHVPPATEADGTEKDGAVEITRRVALTLSAPFDSKKADKVDVGSLSGLTAGTTGSLDVSFLFWPSATDVEDAGVAKLCADLLGKLFVAHDWHDVSHAGFTCNRRLFTYERLKEVAKALNARREDCKKCSDSSVAAPSRCALLSEAAAQACSNLGADAARASLCALARAERTQHCEQCDKLLPECMRLNARGEAKLVDDARDILAANRKRIATVQRAAFPGQHGLNVSLKANREEFSYVLADAPAANPTGTQEEGIGLSVAWSYLTQSSLWAIGYSHEESYKAGSKTQVCSPLGTTGSTTCREVSIGAPKRETGELGFVENRLLIAKGKFAVAPRAEYDFETSDWGLRVPFYFVPHTKAKDALTGGIALGYAKSDDEDKDGFGVTVFVSKAFSLLE